MTMESDDAREKKRGAPVSIFGAQYLGTGPRAAPALCGDFRGKAEEVMKAQVPKITVPTDKKQ